MPPAICDSEDEDGDLVAAARSSQRSIGSWAARQVSAIAATLDGADERTTGSTAQLRDDLRNAGLDLFPASNPSQNPWSSLNSVQSIQKSQADAGIKQNITTGSLDDHNIFERASKRQKTAGHTTASQHDGPLIFQNQNTQGDKALVSFAGVHVPGRYSEHSAPDQPSTGLPDSTLFQQFINHEPLVMFQDTCETLVDNASLQERMIADAIAANAQLQNEASELPSELDPLRSPSFPYSSSNRNTQKTTVESQQTAVESQRTDDLIHDNVVLPPQISDMTDKLASIDQMKTSVTESAIDKHEAVDASSPKPSAKHAQAATKPTDIRNLPKAKKPKAQKKSADAQIADLGSQFFDFDDDLPQENYQPRPSRRRTATKLSDSASNSPSVPVRSSKKRSKTSDDFASESPASSKVSLASKNKRKSSEPTKNMVDDNFGEHQPQQNDALAEETYDTIRLKLSPSPDKKVEESQNEAAIESSDHLADASVKRGSSSRKKTKRNGMAILEDDDEGDNLARKPAVDEQQAESRHAMVELPTNPAITSQRKRRIIHDDDDDSDLDELAMKSPDGKDTAKKRGRGRPSKAKSIKGAKSASFAVDESDQDDLAERDGEPLQVKADKETIEHEEKPSGKENENMSESPVKPVKKKGRGRPPKAKAVQEDDQIEKHVPEASKEDEATTSTEAGKMDEPAAPLTPSIIRRTSQTLTPPPEKVTGVGDVQSSRTSKAEQLSKPAVTTASTIKAAKYRVGLSKRQRIQPLHSSIRRK